MSSLLSRTRRKASEVDISVREIVQALAVAPAPARQHRPSTLIAWLQATAPVADPTKRRQFRSLDPARSVLWPSMSALGQKRTLADHAAQTLIESWRRHWNAIHPHVFLGGGIVTLWSRNE